MKQSQVKWSAAGRKNTELDRRKRGVERSFKLSLKGQDSPSTNVSTDSQELT